MVRYLIPRPVFSAGSLSLGKHIKTSQSLNVLMRLRQDVVPLVLEADNRGAVNLNTETHPCGTPSCFLGYASDVSARQEWYDQFADWQEQLWQRDQGLWSSLFGVAASGILADRISRLDRMIADEMAGIGSLQIQHLAAQRLTCYPITITVQAA